MHVQLRKLVAIVLVAAYSSAATAGLQDALDGMFMATATTPAAYSSQTRGGFVGGGVGVRMPVRNINLVAFDPPRFSAGCGGIDLYGGSFSFINADQLTALFRQIAANAAGALFKIAIDSINPQLGKIMEDFQSKLQQLNSMFKNTCAIANQIVNPSPASNP
ncbi:MAG: conjugal transfer protein TraH, partial [Gammaproteobacteria bacterium]|nr:conjugal transfer protein TraH [Gammaproteobacteria bacterium]